MATTTPSPTPKTLTLISTSSLFLSSYTSFSSSLSPQPTPPLSFHLLSSNSPLPPPPPDLPPSKLIPKTRFLVDGFRSSGDFSVSYFLSHFHSDHYTGLGPAWSRGLIFCSPTTARLLTDILNVPQSFVVPFPLAQPLQIDGCCVTAVDANHCPGAVQFLFDLPGAKGKYVHTGDFRFCDSMKSDPHLCRFIGADAVFLDTTYCNPKFVFPSQDESVKYIVTTIRRIKDQNKGSPVLFLIATYVVGKEKILLDIARQCNCLVYVDSRKMKILSNLGFADSGVFTEDASSSDIHVIGWNLLGETWPYFRPNFVKMRELATERGYSNAVGFVATGWMYETKGDGFASTVKDSLEVHLVPYSEHSSYVELREYVRFLRPKRVVPTVGADVERLDGKHAVSLQKHFAGLVDETANKQEFLMAFHQKVADGAARAGHEMTNSREEPRDVDKSGKGSSYQVSNMLNDDAIEGVVNELRDCLPSWASRDQILGLLRDSGGDIVKAVSYFFEHEIELYDEANACTPSCSGSQSSLQNDAFSFPDLKPAQENPKPAQENPKPAQENLDCNKKDYLFQDKKLTNKNTAAPHSSFPKKRVSTTGNKPRKKRKPSTTPESGGSKQPTITNYFGKLILNTSGDDGCGTTTGDQIPANGKPLLLCAVENEMYKEELDQFLQVISGGIARASAASLLEKAEGNIDVAVDMYYNNLNTISSSEKSLVPCNVQADIHVGLVGSCNKKSSDQSKETTKMGNLFVQGVSEEDTNVANVSLPIEMYSPIEHACWKAGQPAPYLHLVRTFDLVEKEKGKIRTARMLCNMFRSLLALSPDDVLSAMYLCTNKIAADHENMLGTEHWRKPGNSCTGRGMWNKQV